MDPDESMRKLLFNYKLQFAVNLGLLFYPWYFYSLVSNILIFFTIINLIINFALRIFFLFLGFINASNEFYTQFGKSDIIVSRNIVSSIFVSIMLCIFALLTYLISYACFTSENALNITFCPAKWGLILSIIVGFSGFIGKILFDINLSNKRKRSSKYHSVFFLHCKIRPSTLHNVLFWILSKYAHNDNYKLYYQYYFDGFVHHFF